VRVRIDPSSLVPVSGQLVDSIRAGIERGRPAPGERLAPVRTLAGDLGLAPNTVAKAYRALERDGYLETRGRAGTFVSGVLPTPLGDVERRLTEAAAAFVRRARQLGASDAEIARAVETARRNARRAR